MSRIFLSLCLAGSSLVAVAFFLGLGIDDPADPSAEVVKEVSRHMLLGLGGLIFASLIHAIVLTYFMGTGRWLEETSRAYKLAPTFHADNQKIKYRLIPGLMACILMLIMIAAFGGTADPASSLYFESWLGFSSSTIHLTVAVLAVVVNVVVSIHEFRSIERNGEIIDQVMNEVNRIRTERGLPV